MQGCEPSRRMGPAFARAQFNCAGLLGTSTLTIQMSVKWLRAVLLKARRRHRADNFSLYVTGQILIVLGMVHTSFVAGSWLTQPFLLIGLLLFHIFYWLTPTGIFRNVHLYFAVQSLIACLAFTQSFLSGYLFLILVGQSVIRLRVRSALIWIGVFISITLYGNFDLYGGMPTSSPGSVIPTIVGFVLIGSLSNRIVQERRAQARIRHLMTDLSDAYARLQESAEQSRDLAVAEERNRLASELRHVIGHRLTTAIVQLEGASRLMEDEPQRAAGMIGTVRAQLDSGLHELRYTFKDLPNPVDFDTCQETESRGEQRDDRSIASESGRQNGLQRAPTRGAPTNCHSVPAERPISSRRNP